MRSFIICTILAFCCLAIGCKGFAFRVATENMLPTIKVGETCIVDQYSPVEVQRFDIVMFKAPEAVKKLTREEGDVKFISRVIGLPNEKIEIKNDKVFVNDKLLEEPFEKITESEYPNKDFPAITIPENSYFILGDNRPNSFDSRFWKPAAIKKEDILGKVVKILPLDVKN
jgi:signal peptidase I